MGPLTKETGYKTEPLEKGRKNILVSPLDWGLGHAARLVPLIDWLILNKYNVILCGNGHSLDLIKAEFPDLECHHLPSLKIKYSGLHSLLLQVIISLPRLYLNIVREKRAVKRIVRTLRVSAIISDNRYGLRSRNTKNILITHQLQLHFPDRYRYPGMLANRILRKWISRFDHCLVPDSITYPGLAGKLSHPETSMAGIDYIGPLSRFKGIPPSEIPSTIDLLIVLSGPEPQRTILESILCAQVESLNKKVVLIRGNRNLSAGIRIENRTVEVVPFMERRELLNAIQNASLVVCRSGYSSIMDLLAIGKQAVLVPTPGQSEQEYLAQLMTELGYFFHMSQNSFRIEEAIVKSQSYNPSVVDLKYNNFESSLSRILG